MGSGAKKKGWAPRLWPLYQTFLELHALQQNNHRAPAFTVKMLGYRALTAGFGIWRNLGGFFRVGQINGSSKTQSVMVCRLHRFCK